MNRIASHCIVLGGTYSRYNSCQKKIHSLFQGSPSASDHFVSLVGTRRFAAGPAFSFDDDALFFCCFGR